VAGRHIKPATWQFPNVFRNWQGELNPVLAAIHPNISLPLPLWRPVRDLRVRNANCRKSLAPKHCLTPIIALVS